MWIAMWIAMWIDMWIDMWMDMWIAMLVDIWIAMCVYVVVCLHRHSNKPYAANCSRVGHKCMRACVHMRVGGWADDFSAEGLGRSATFIAGTPIQPGFSPARLVAACLVAARLVAACLVAACLARA